MFQNGSSSDFSIVRGCTASDRPKENGVFSCRWVMRRSVRVELRSIVLENDEKINKIRDRPANGTERGEIRCSEPTFSVSTAAAAQSAVPPPL